MEKFLIILGSVALMFLVFFVNALILLLFWNWIMPDLFNLPIITYWQAYGLCVISGILFKSTDTNSSK